MNEAKLSGTVVSGNKLMTKVIAKNSSELRAILGVDPFPGSLNLILDRPCRLDEKHAFRFGRCSLVWKATLNDAQVWVQRWARCPLHVLEALSPVRLRDSLDLEDGDSVEISISQECIGKIGRLDLLAWLAIWSGRRRWFYERHNYRRWTKRLAMHLGATQRERSTIRWIIKQIRRRLARKFPILRRVKRALIGGGRPPYVFERSEAATELERIGNLLNYTKTSGSAYSARQYPAGYHTIEMEGVRLEGQRDPDERLRTIPFDFRDKIVLDIGSNQGGMLFQIKDLVKQGIGIDYDYRLVNVANRISASTDTRNLSFYVFNLETEPLDLIRDLLPNGRADIVMMLSICIWIGNWREVIDFALSISDVMLLETNGTGDQQVDQREYLAARCATMQPLAWISDDDRRYKRRALFLADNRPH